MFEIFGCPVFGSPLYYCLYLSTDEPAQTKFFWLQIDDADYARQLGLRDPPTLVHFSGGVPSIYYGEEKKDPILAWLIHLKEEAVIEVITEEILVDLIEEEEYVMVFFR